MRERGLENEWISYVNDPWKKPAVDLLQSRLLDTEAISSPFMTPQGLHI